MGCDIHPYIQYKAEHEWLVGWSVEIGRNYDLFGLMAGVRGGAEPVADVRGLPGRVAWLIDDEAFLYEDGERRLDPDGHTHSWLTIDELREVHKRYHSSTDALYPEWELQLILTAMEGMAKQGREPILVFWFDN
jgi:hypothetical protein